MALKMVAEIYDGQGEKMEESFFGSLQPVRSWAKEREATFIKVVNAEDKSAKFYLKGNKGRWGETTEDMFNFIVGRNTEDSENGSSESGKVEGE